LQGIRNFSKTLKEKVKKNNKTLTNRFKRVKCEEQKSDHSSATDDFDKQDKRLFSSRNKYK